MSEEEHKRKIVIPGETIVSGENYLPGEGTEKRNKDIVAQRYGLAEESNQLVRIIPLSGVYLPRKGNVIIGRVVNITFNGWIIDIGSSNNSFLSVAEFPRYISKDDIEDVMGIGDMVVAKVIGIHRNNIDLGLKSRGLGKIDEGLIIRVNANKVPRVIGKEGSMINLIKENTGCNITVGQNGLIWIQGDTIDKELLAKKSILFIVERSFIDGLTEKVQDFFKKEKK